MIIQFITMPSFLCCKVSKYLITFLLPEASLHSISLFTYDFYLNIGFFSIRYQRLQFHIRIEALIWVLEYVFGLLFLKINFQNSVI